MKAAGFLTARRDDWQALEKACDRQRRRGSSGEDIARFAALYRSACADLALADAYQLPPATVSYLHKLVGRAHNRLYRGRAFAVRTWARELLSVVPGRLYRDVHLWVAALLFWGVFFAAGGLAWRSPEFAQAMVGEETLAAYEEMYSQPIDGRVIDEGAAAAGFYVQNNTGIGLSCFAAGLLAGVGGLFVTVTNASLLGAVFGHMTRSPSSDNFYQFVTAHGPFELTAIVLAAAAGMRLGFSWVSTGGWTRRASLHRGAREAVPVMGLSMILFLLAAMIEGFVSPSGLPYAAKAAVAVVSTLALLFYLVVLGRLGSRQLGT